MNLVPFILGVPETTARLAQACPLPNAVVLDVLQPETLPFYQLLNAGNQMAFGGLGMPAWVQLDCCTLPTAMVGFAVARADVPPQVMDGLTQHVSRVFGAQAALALAAHQGLVPVSEYTALHTFDASRVVGFSLFSVLGTKGLGLRTKALALACYGARTQVGMTQYNNSAVRTHALLGPLRITHAVAPPHSRPQETFVYTLEVPPREHLARLASGDVVVPPQDLPTTQEIPVEEPAQAAATVVALLQAGRRVHVVTPGLLTRDNKTYMALHVD
jgi:hypothetical protein